MICIIHDNDDNDVNYDENYDSNGNTNKNEREWDKMIHNELQNTILKRPPIYKWVILGD